MEYEPLTRRVQSFADAVANDDWARLSCVQQAIIDSNRLALWKCAATL